MMKMRNVVLCAVFGTLGLFLPSIASAETVNFGSPTWNGSPITLGDKVFTFTGETGIGGTTVQIFEPVAGIFTVELSQFKDDSGANLIGPWTGSLSYDVQITGGPFNFSSVELDSTHVGSGVDVTKTVTGSFGTASLLSHDGGIATASLGGTLIHVTETFGVGANGGLLNTADSYTQVAGEPGVFAMLAGFGATVAGFHVWRRRKTAIAN